MQERRSIVGGEPRRRQGGPEPAGGAAPTLHAALAPEVEGGQYFGPGSLMELRGEPDAAYVSRRARDETVAAELWDRSVALTHVDFGALAA